MGGKKKPTLLEKRKALIKKKTKQGRPKYAPKKK